MRHRSGSNQCAGACETAGVGESPRERTQNEKRAKGWVPGKTFKMLAEEKCFPKVHPGREKCSHRIVEFKERQSQIRGRITWCSFGWATRRLTRRLTAYRAFFFCVSLAIPLFLYDLFYWSRESRS